MSLIVPFPCPPKAEARGSNPFGCTIPLSFAVLGPKSPALPDDGRPFLFHALQPFAKPGKGRAANSRVRDGIGGLTGAVTHPYRNRTAKSNSAISEEAA